MSKKRLHQVLNLETGLFSHIDNPLWEGRYDSIDMDLEFITSYGDRYISPLVKHFTRDRPLDEVSSKRIINLIYNKYKESWTRQYQVLETSYDILDNYMMVETEKIDRDTLENNLSDILKNTTYSKNEIVDLIENIKRNERSTLDREENEKYKDDKTMDGFEDSTNTKDGVNRINKVDSLTFNDRYDISENDSTRDVDINETGGNDTKETLGFDGRYDEKDSYVTRTEDNTEKTVTNTNEYERSNTDEETGRYGFNSNISVPETEQDSTSIVNNDIDSEEDKTIKNEMKDSVLDRNRKYGTEITETDTTTNKTSKEKETNIENSKVGKTGEEIHSIGEDATNREDEFTTTNTGGNEELKGSRDGTIKDIGEGEGTTDTKSDRSSEEDGEELESQQLTSNTIGELAEERELTRRGNIGVATTSEILRQHIEFWQYNFLDQVYKDTVKMMTLDIY